MIKRTVTQVAPFIIPPLETGSEVTPDNPASLHLVHNGESYAFKWVPKNHHPQFINPSTGEIRRLVTNMTGDTRSNQKHGRIILAFEDSLASDSDGSVIPEWDWAEWLPYCPECPTNGTLQSLPPGIPLPPGYE